MISLFWIGLAAFLLFALALDLGVFHREARAQTAGEAALWSLVWVSTALIFNVFVYFAYEHHWLGIGFNGGPSSTARRRRSSSSRPGWSRSRSRSTTSS